MQEDDVRRSVRILAAAVLVLGLAGLAATWLLSGRTGDAILAQGPSSGAQAATLPVPVTAEGTRGLPAPLASDAVSAAAPDAGAEAPPEPGHPVTFTGRVLDDAGRPVKDAEVIHLPSNLMREAAGFKDPKRYWYTPWERSEER